MTLSFRTLSFKLGILPSMLVASLALGACQNSTSPNEKEKTEHAKAVDNELDNEDEALDANETTDKPITDYKSAEQTMISTLSDHRWTLISVMGKKSQPLNELAAVKDEVRLSFNQYQGQDTLNYSVGCNTISANYQLQGSVLSVDDSMSTKMLCPDLNAAENSLIDLMEGDSQIVVTKNDASQEEQTVLTQLTNEETTLVWEGQLTDQAKYNSKGETVFWAVNAKKISCNDTTADMCLQVKPITYDNQGIKSREGKWVPFAGVIDGYHPDGKHDEILRIQRYTVDADANIPASDSDLEAPSSAYAYVLDAVIESSVAE
ncbi:META domain-containing protein [Psychrobacter alimentarius]|uniref:META domain-containing protein n=1 Tax=Psychrobacter alimentarius TaxID=261164 RepID=UPI0019183F7F|nr:META domain-containing protein [Psychrobacter alimentarius]